MSPFMQKRLFKRHPMPLLRTESSSVNDSSSALALSHRWSDRRVDITNRLSCERGTLLTMALVLLPWVGVVLFTAGAWAALNCLAYAVIVSAAGYIIVFAVAPVQRKTQLIVLAPALGVLAISALTAFWVRLGLPITWAPALWLGLSALGALAFRGDRAFSTKRTVEHGGALVVLSALICAIFFLPGALNDAVLRRDGSFNWIYVDTQYFHSVAAVIKNAQGPPKSPGTATEELLYHFAPYAPAAAISRLTRLDLGDVFARVTRGVSLWALILACFGLGTLLSIEATGKTLGGIISVAGFFFYGSLLSLFTNEANSSSHISGAILFRIPDVAVLADGGPFSHLILGHSMLHGMLAISAVMGSCLVHTERPDEFTWRHLSVLTLPALAVAVNSVVAIYCLGIVGILMFWGRLWSARSWILILLMCCLFLGTLKMMGYVHSPEAAETTIKQHISGQWWSVTIAFIAGLGFRVSAFRWTSRGFWDPVAALFIASVIGFLLFSLAIQLGGGNEHYGIYFLQCMFSMFAFSQLTSGFWREAERSRCIAEWLRLTTKGMLVLITWGILIAIFAYSTHTHPGIASFRFKLFFSLTIFSLFAGTSALMERNRQFAKVASTILFGVLLIGFGAWITPWSNFGLGRMKMDVTLTPGEVRGLYRLGELSEPNERFATNKHAVDTLAAGRERSYAYAALSERPVLLEGYLDHGVTILPWFQNLLRDNDLLFTATDPDTVRNIAKFWSVRWLVARPGTDIALSKPLPPWLVEEQGSGDLKIYRIDY